MASEKRLLAEKLFSEGKSRQEIAEATGLSRGYLANILWDIRHPSAMARAQEGYQARYPERRKDSRKQAPDKEAERIERFKQFIAKTRANPKLRNLLRKKYYRKGALHARNGRTIWPASHLDRITAPRSERPSDSELAIELGRSVQAIQVMRTRLKK